MIDYVTEFSTSNLSVIANKKKKERVFITLRSLFKEFLQFKNLSKGNRVQFSPVTSWTVESQSKFLYNELLLTLIFIRVSHELLRQASG